MGLLFLKNHHWLIVGFSLVAAALTPVGFPFDQWGLFGFGVACHFLIRGDGVAAGILVAICLTGLARVESPTVIAVGLVTALCIVHPPPTISLGLFRPLQRVGDFSYSLYLVHVPIGCYLLPHYVFTAPAFSLATSLGRDSVLLAACLGVTAVFYRLVEKPSHDFARATDAHASLVKVTSTS